MSDATYTEIKRQGPYVVYQHDQSGKFTLVRESSDGSQVFDAMPGDGPSQSGTSFYARNTGAGINYVSNLYSRGYVMRTLHELVRED